jgi:pyridoxine/pyridoxamine 5'-phosphate oxidase
MSERPHVSRPGMPEGYGMPAVTSLDDTVSWSWVDDQLTRARNYWIASSRPDGRPHAMPVWGIWLDGQLVFGTDRDSRKGRNIAQNPAVVVHLDSGDEVVILEGVAEEVTDGAVLDAADTAYHAKYDVHLVSAPGAVVIYAVRPKVAFAWLERDFFKATRWRFATSA